MNSNCNLTENIGSDLPVKKSWSTPDVVLISSNGDGIESVKAFTSTEFNATNGPSS